MYLRRLLSVHFPFVYDYISVYLSVLVFDAGITTSGLFSRFHFLYFAQTIQGNLLNTVPLEHGVEIFLYSQVYLYTTPAQTLAFICFNFMYI